MDFEKLKSIMVIMTTTTTTTMMMMMMMMIIVSPLHALFFCRAEAEEVSHSETSSPNPVKREQKRRHRFLLYDGSIYAVLVLHTHNAPR